LDTDTPRQERLNRLLAERDAARRRGRLHALQS